jgi:hypothetical protein
LPPVDQNASSPMVRIIGGFLLPIRAATLTVTPQGEGESAVVLVWKSLAPAGGI